MPCHAESHAEEYIEGLNRASEPLFFLFYTFLYSTRVKTRNQFTLTPLIPIPVSSQRCCCRDGLLSSDVTRLHWYYSTIRLPELHQLFLFYYHLFNLLSSLKDCSGSRQLLHALLYLLHPCSRPELPIIPNTQHAMLSNPETAQ